MKPVQTAETRKPRSGSDYALQHTAQIGEDRVAILAVLDTIGQAPTGPMKKFIGRFDDALGEIMRGFAPVTLEAMEATVTDLILQGNAELVPMNREKRDIFGFCITVCIIHNRECRIMQLGDCRAWLMEHQPGGNPSAKMLTRDQNSLAMVMEAEGEYTFLSNELLELSRTLHFYWGKPDQDSVKAALEKSKRAFQLSERCCLFLSTDGVFLPLIRGLLDLSNYKLTREQFSLEPWLVNFLDTGEYLIRPGQWQQLAPEMIHLAERYTARKPRYRDDMAAVTAWIE